MQKSLGLLCRHRFLFAVPVGLGLGWALTPSLGAGSAFAVGGAFMLSLLHRRGAG